MATISQTTLLIAFSWMKMWEVWLDFQWSLFLRVLLTIFQHWFRWWLGAEQATSHYLNQSWPVYWRIYASLGLNELSHPYLHVVFVLGVNVVTGLVLFLFCFFQPTLTCMKIIFHRVRVSTLVSRQWMLIVSFHRAHACRIQVYIKEI